MASGLFDVAAESLEAHSVLDRLEARGTLRLALKAGGLDAESLTVKQLDVVLERVLPMAVRVVVPSGRRSFREWRRPRW